MIIFRTRPLRIFFPLIILLSQILLMLFFIFSTSPSFWKYANIIPIRKYREDPALTRSYKPISLLPGFGNITGDIFFFHDHTVSTLISHNNSVSGQNISRLTNCFESLNIFMIHLVILSMLEPSS